MGFELERVCYVKKLKNYGQQIVGPKRRSLRFLVAAFVGRRSVNMVVRQQRIALVEFDSV
jgi:hypothetical protein